MNECSTIAPNAHPELVYTLGGYELIHSFPQKSANKGVDGW